jgi:hypothetical protein
VRAEEGGEAGRRREGRQEGEYRIAEYLRQRIRLLTDGVDPVITGELPEERARTGLTRTGRVRPVIAG